jgi:hypothetical protein
MARLDGYPHRMGVAAIYEGWPRVQAHLVARLPVLGPEELQLRGSADGWPVWAMLSHVAVVRVYWLCVVLGEPGVETTPFPDPAREGWEDRLDVPRQPAELLFALESSWGIVESSLERWTPEMLGEMFDRERGGAVERHSRQSVLTRLVMHDAFHCGEASLVLGQHGLASLDPWAPLA